MTYFILCKSGALPGTEIALSLFVLNSTEPKEPLLGSPRISSYCKSFSVSVQFQQTGGGGGLGGLTGGMPCITHMLANSLVCEGWDAGGSSAWLGKCLSSSGGQLAGIHTASEGWLNNVWGYSAKLCCASCLSAIWSGQWTAMPPTEVTSRKQHFWAKWRQYCLNAYPSQRRGRKPKTQLTKQFNFVLKPNHI